MTNIIQVQGLCKHFQTLVKHDGFAGSMRSLFHPERESVKAVQDITFEIEQGERLAFIGPNGAGKSTTIKMLVGILYPTAGSAQVLSYTPWKQRQQLAYHIGTVFGQKSQISYHLPAQDSFDLLAHIYGLEKPDYSRRLAYLKELFDTEEFLTTPVRKLSLGQRMRCEITAALLHKPKILFLDEPTIGLDVVVKQRIRDLILELNQQEQVTVFLTSHDAGDVEVLCRRAMVINHGEVIYDGQVNDLKHNYLRTKTVSLKLGQDWKGFDAQGVTLLKHRDYGVKLEVNTEVTSIDRVIAQLLAQYSIVDINVDNPPMEQVIAQIYGQDREATR